MFSIVFICIIHLYIFYLPTQKYLCKIIWPPLNIYLLFSGSDFFIFFCSLLLCILPLCLSYVFLSKKRRKILEWKTTYYCGRMTMTPKNSILGRFCQMSRGKDFFHSCRDVLWRRHVLFYLNYLKGIVQKILRGVVETRRIPSKLVNWRPARFFFLTFKGHHHKRSIKPFISAA